MGEGFLAGLPALLVVAIRLVLLDICMPEIKQALSGKCMSQSVHNIYALHLKSYVAGK